MCCSCSHDMQRTLAMHKSPCQWPCCYIRSSLNTVTFAGLQGGGADGQSYTVVQAAFGPSMAALVSSTASAPLTLIKADPADGCTPFKSPTVFAGKAVIMQRGNCSFQAKASLSGHT